MAECERCGENPALEYPDYFAIRAILRYPLDLCQTCTDAFQAMFHAWWISGRPKLITEIREALAAAERGETEDLGSFARYADG